MNSAVNTSEKLLPNTPANESQPVTQTSTQQTATPGNTQKTATPGALQINDLFWTLQGEGRWSGRRALFVRLPFCNYNCPWCDTEYNSFKKVSATEFVEFAKSEPARFAVITGGEPMAHKDLSRIIMLLKNEGFEVACETNGSLPIPSDIDFPTVSPKRYTQKKYPEYFIHDDAFQKAREFKYVVDDDFDFTVLNRHRIVKPNSDTAKNRDAHSNPTTDLQQNPSQEIRYSLTPEYSTMQRQLPRILEFIKQHPQWQLNLQTHKWIHIP
jgi:7-carboxy-7-deazaguanine synthase